jgi:hypothetical protein
MANVTYPEGQYYALADNCPHDIGNEDEEPDDGIHIPEDQDGYLICLEMPMPTPAPHETQPVVKGYIELLNFIQGRVALQCEECGTIVSMVSGQENWMVKHVYYHSNPAPQVTGK